jgi:putative spermidine/putrescine transport system ATP-binding protein
MTVVRIEGLTKRYGAGAKAVDGLSLEIGDAELLSLLGPSGCGKTTTLRCIAGFAEAEAGRIAFDGVDIAGRPPEKRNIGMVFQNYALFPHMTVRDNLNFGLAMRKVAKPEAERRIAEVLETVQLGGLHGRYPRELSGGQQQRVALARALVIEPSVLLLDEPLANLDAKLRDEMRFFIRSLQKRIGITTVYVTHDQAEAMVMSDRIVVMFDGRIAQVGAPAEIYARPNSRRVADFIGLSNFVAGRVMGTEAGEMHVIDTALGKLRCPSAARLAPGTEALVMVRPEALSVAPETPANGANAFSGIVRERHFLGNLAQMKIACPDGTIVQVEDEAWSGLAVGDAVWCAFPPERSWLIVEGNG